MASSGDPRIAVHVAGMYLPSPLTGWLVDRYGRLPVAAASGITLLAAGILAATAHGDSVIMLAVALALLGFGWNPGLVAGTAIITDTVPLATRAETQGTVDVAIAIAGATGGMGSGLMVAATSYPTLAGGLLALTVVPADPDPAATAAEGSTGAAAQPEPGPYRAWGGRTDHHCGQRHRDIDPENPDRPVHRLPVADLDISQRSHVDPATTSAALTGLGVTGRASRTTTEPEPAARHRHDRHPLGHDRIPEHRRHRRFRPEPLGQPLQQPHRPLYRTTIAIAIATGRGLLYLLRHSHHLPNPVGPSVLPALP